MIIESGGPVNARVIDYDADGLRLRINGKGPTTLLVRSGALPIESGVHFQVSIGRARTWVTEVDGVISIEAPVNGEVQVSAERFE